MMLLDFFNLFAAAPIGERRQRRDGSTWEKVAAKSWRKVKSADGKDYSRPLHSRMAVGAKVKRRDGSTWEKVAENKWKRISKEQQKEKSMDSPGFVGQNKGEAAGEAGRATEPAKQERKMTKGASEQTSVPLPKKKADRESAAWVAQTIGRASVDNSLLDFDIPLNREAASQELFSYLMDSGLAVERDGQIFFNPNAIDSVADEWAREQIDKGIAHEREIASDREMSSKHRRENAARQDVIRKKRAEWVPSAFDSIINQITKRDLYIRTQTHAFPVAPGSLRLSKDGADIQHWGGKSRGWITLLESQVRDLARQAGVVRS